MAGNGVVALDGLATALGHRFTDMALLEQAVTHPSATTPARPDNQRLEFLGDSVLGLSVAHALYAAKPEWAEGELTRALHALVVGMARIGKSRLEGRDDHGHGTGEKAGTAQSGPSSRSIEG